MTAETTKKSGGALILDYFRDFKVLGENPKEFWATQVINFLDSTAYFAMITILSLFLSTSVGFSKIGTGYIMTAFTSLITIGLLASGVMTDVLGLRKSIYISFLGKAICYFGVFWVSRQAPSKMNQWLIVGLLILSAPTLALTQSVFQAANVRYTTKRTRSAGFNLWYLFMNVGAALGGYLVDVVRLKFKLAVNWLIFANVIASVMSLIICMFLITSEKQAVGADEIPEEPAEKVTETKKPKSLEILKAMLKEPAFFRFLVMIALLLGVRAVFTYMYLLMPIYWTEVMGEDARIGTLNMINPILIVVGLILFIPLSNKFNIFKMLTYGALISAMSLVVLVFPWKWFSKDFVSAYYIMAFISQVVLSIGEVIWSPKLQEYTAAIAPKGQEGTYLGMSTMPWFIAKMVVSALSGYMLSYWCPTGIGPRLREGTVDFWHSPEAMWLVLAIWAVSGPVLAILLRGWLTKGARWNTTDSPATPS